MRYPAAEKAEIIQLVEQSHMAAKQTLDTLGIGDELGDVGSPERHAVKEPQGAHDLVEPGHEMPLPARCT